MTYYLGLDIGTTNIKGLLLNSSDKKVISVTRQTKTVYPGIPGWAEFNPDDVYQIVIDVIREIRSKGG